MWLYESWGEYAGEVDPSALYAVGSACPECGKPLRDRERSTYSEDMQPVPCVDCPSEDCEFLGVAL